MSLHIFNNKILLYIFAKKYLKNVHIGNLHLIGARNISDLLGESEISPWSVKLFNSSSNQFLYIELDGASGILKNATFFLGEEILSRIRLSEGELPYTEKIYYTINASTGINGDIDPKGDIEVLEGEDITFDFTPDTGYLVDDVIVDGVSVGNLSSYTFNNVNSNHSIEVTFKEDRDITIPGYSPIFFLLINSAIISVITIYWRKRTNH